MKQYGKLSKGSVTYAPNRIEHDGLITINPTDEQLEAAGYSEVVTSKQPEKRKGYTATATWKKVKGKIVQAWEYAATDK